MTRRRMIGMGVGGGLVVILLGIFLLGRVENDRILKNVRVGTLAVGGLNHTDARQMLETARDAYSRIILAIDGRETEYALSELGIAIDSDATLEEIVQLGASSNFIRNAWYRVYNWFVPIEVPATLTRDRVQFDYQLNLIVASVSVTEQDARLEFREGTWQIIPSQLGRTLSPAQLESAITSAVGRLSPPPISITTTRIEPAVATADIETIRSVVGSRTRESITLTIDNESLAISPAQLAVWTEVVATSDDPDRPVQFRLNQSKITAYVETIASRYNRESIDARVQFRGGQLTITQDSLEGRAVTEEPLASQIAATFLGDGERTIPIPTNPIEPAVSSATLASLGLQELIGTALTSYAGSPDNRRHNITNGEKYLTGRVVKPGEEFSVVKALGSVDDTTGYLPELVIKEDRTVPEFGGGLCQVSTTLFRAALNAGLKITERQNHSYRVSYYERGVGPGLDATIYLPNPDFKFLNDTPGWILVQGHIDEDRDEITFELYGTKDGRRSEVSAPEITSVTDPPPPIYVETTTLPAGEVKQLEKPHAGAKTTVTYAVYRDNELILNQTFRSNYKAWPARYLVGTGAVSESPPTDDPSAT